jgi:hypothetical protein
MKHVIIKRITSNEIARVTVTLADKCHNGYDNFSYACDLFALNGDKKECGITFERRMYREHGTDNTKEFMLKYFAELNAIFILSNCDIKGLPCYPLMNGAYYLENNPEYAKKSFRLTTDEVKNLQNFKPLSLAKYLHNLTKTRYKFEVKTAINLLESLTNQKYITTDVVSPYLYNDLHYVLIDKKKGWNIYKSETNKKKLKYHLDLSI